MQRHDSTANPSVTKYLANPNVFGLVDLKGLMDTTSRIMIAAEVWDGCLGDTANEGRGPAPSLWYYQLSGERRRAVFTKIIIQCNSEFGKTQHSMITKWVGAGGRRGARLRVFIIIFMASHHVVVLTARLASPGPGVH